ncbi:tRNA pseudouridine(13) synthase TruD [Candidatus Thorarchaeota archaeon]|jgi:tRNA pseudouridine13 synthase|nr:MAG: tRNA pseudouridine(13) synthase TruD [Candidatus Thorarchaeota archaeon]
MKWYSTVFDGIGGKLKTRFEDFVVEEITPEGQPLEVTDWGGKQSRPLVIQDEVKKPKFVIFTLQKMGISTMGAANIIAASLKVSRAHITYAGLKDKRAVTAQAMSGPVRISDDLSKLNLSNIMIRGFRHSRRPVQIGDLWGNRFNILVREIDPPCEKARGNIEKITEIPLLNYYGIQRFGLTRPITHIVGKALVQSNYREAVRTMLCTPGEYESDELKAAREELSKDLQPTSDTIEAFPQSLGYERDVMKQLLRDPDDFQRAISRIPPRMLTLFVHAYQSYLFNHLISERAESGMSLTKPHPGDFLIQLDQTHSGRDSWLYVTEASLDERAAQVSAGEYGIAVPVPGYSTRLPPSKQSDVVRRLLKEESVTLRDFRNTDVKALDSPGGLHLAAIVVADLETSCSEDGLRVRFRLRKGSYATVVLREIMKNHPINRV